MRGSGKVHRLSALAALTVGVVSALGAQTHAATATTSTASAGLPPAVRPHAVGELDCNGLSPVQRPAKAGIMCADPRGPYGGRFYENGHYIGHDEPSVRFLSGRRGSGSNVTMAETLPKDPFARPTVSHPGHDITHWFELSIAPWVSLTVCDPNSAPLLPCTPRSDSNAPHGRFLGGGAAFVELQFYPPGFAPFSDSISCDNARWCSALTIDSLECTGNGSGPCNNNCVEPVNFGFIQDNGVPTGPPRPYMINSQFEIGHFEPCTFVQGKVSGVKDTTYTTCRGPHEKAKDTSAAFEPDDSPCYRVGDTHGGTVPPNLVTGCDVFDDAIGDLDFDGSGYYPDWPDSTTAFRFPSPFLQHQPTTVGGHRYPRFQFMTDASATESNTKCSLTSGHGCVLPPKGPGHFYPFWTQAKVGGSCVWEFGNMTNGKEYGRDAQYGSVRPDTMGAFVGPILRDRGCGRGH